MRHTHVILVKQISQNLFLLHKIHTSVCCGHENVVLCIAGPLGSVWTRYYCTYEKSAKMFTMSSTESRAANRQVSRCTDSSIHQFSNIFESAATDNTNISGLLLSQSSWCFFKGIAAPLKKPL